MPIHLQNSGKNKLKVCSSLTPAWFEILIAFANLLNMILTEKTSAVFSISVSPSTTTNFKANEESLAAGAAESLMTALSPDQLQATNPLRFTSPGRDRRSDKRLSLCLQTALMQRAARSLFVPPPPCANPPTPPRRRAPLRAGAAHLRDAPIVFRGAARKGALSAGAGAVLLGFAAGRGDRRRHPRRRGAGGRGGGIHRATGGAGGGGGAGKPAHKNESEGG